MTRCHEVRRETPVWFSSPVVVSPAMYDRLLSFDGRCTRGPMYQRCLMTKLIEIIDELGEVEAGRIYAGARA